MKKLILSLTLLSLLNCKKQCIYNVYTQKEIGDKKLIGQFYTCRYSCDKYNSYPPIYHELIYNKLIQSRFCQPDNFMGVE